MNCIFFKEKVQTIDTKIQFLKPAISYFIYIVQIIDTKCSTINININFNNNLQKE